MRTCSCQIWLIPFHAVNNLMGNVKGKYSYWQYVTSKELYYHPVVDWLQILDAGKC